MKQHILDSAEQQARKENEHLRRMQTVGCKDKQAANDLMIVDFGFKEEVEQ